MQTLKRNLIVFITITSFLFPVQNFAQLFGGGPSHAKAELLSEVTSVQPGQTFWVAVKLKMDDHWHVYWRNVGDTGLETAVEWKLPDGFSAGKMNWPYPEKIVEEDLVVFGYHGEQYLLIPVSVDKDVKTGQKVKLSATVSWLVCAETCVPGDTTVSIQLPVKEAAPQTAHEQIRVFAEARAHLPLAKSDWEFTASSENGMITLEARPPQWLKKALSAAEFYPYQADLVKYNIAEKFEPRGKGFRLQIPLKEDAQLPDTLRGILVSPDGWRGAGSERAVEIDIPFGEKEGPDLGGLNSIWLAILFSFLGGIILNLMPCVLPVLSIKIMSFIKQAHDEHIASWKHGVSFTVGVLVSFLALAGLLLILKAGGASLGWGFQLQSPGFIIIVSVFMFLFGLSMLGVYEIGTSMTTVGGKTQGITGLAGSFVSGITAVIVATPCTAPFMGSALGFALTQPVWASLTVFFFLGLGMAAPFLLLSSVPALLKYVPKPGRWMESLEQFMGFLLVGTVLWLLWVLAIQAGSNAVIFVLVDLFITAVGAWIYGRWGNLAMAKRTRVIAWILTFILIVGSNAYVLANIDSYSSSPEAALSNGEGIEWQTFSEEKVTQLVAEGTPVFIDFTAAWCLSCQVNEQVAFGDPEVQKKFKELGIAALKADWTKRDAKIAKALAKFNRNSVPLYVLYSGQPGAAPRLLPEIITPGIVLEALNNIKK